MTVNHPMSLYYNSNEKFHLYRLLYYVQSAELKKEVLDIFIKCHNCNGLADFIAIFNLLQQLELEYPDEIDLKVLLGIIHCHAEDATFNSFLH